MAAAAPRMARPHPGESRLIKLFVSFSVMAHIVFFVISTLDLGRSRIAEIDEWVIDTELSGDFDAGGATTIPKSEKAEKATVPKNLLPQLPKNFTVQEQKKAEDGLAPAEEPKVAEEIKKGDTKDPDLMTKPIDRESAKKLSQKDALRRLALERLRKDLKDEDKSDKTAAPTQEGLAAIAANMRNKINKGVGEKAEASARARYQKSLYVAIRRNYLLPKIYRINKKDLKVIISIVVNARGNLVKVDVKEPSGDQAFDSYAVGAAKAAAPFERPPKTLAGEIILLHFTPKSM